MTKRIPVEEQHYYGGYYPSEGRGENVDVLSVSNAGGSGNGNGEIDDVDVPEGHGFLTDEHYLDWYRNTETATG
jgi:hypothetical protein